MWQCEVKKSNGNAWRRKASELNRTDKFSYAIAKIESGVKLKTYIVKQANLTSRGTGDYFEIGTFSKLNDAIRCVNQNYNDTDGISKHSNGFLETVIEVFVDNEYVETKYSKKYVY